VFNVQNVSGQMHFFPQRIPLVSHHNNDSHKKLPNFVEGQNGQNLVFPLEEEEGEMTLEAKVSRLFQR